MSDFLAGLFVGLNYSRPLDEANKITMWDNRIEPVDQFPPFKNIPRDHSLSIRQFVDYTDENERMKIVHLKV